MISLLAETRAFLDGNLEIYTLELMPNMDYIIIKMQSYQLPVLFIKFSYSIIFSLTKLMGICYLANLYRESFQTLLGSLPNLNRKFANIYLEGCQTLLVNLLGSLPNFVLKVDKIDWEGLQTLLGRLPNFIG